MTLQDSPALAVEPLPGWHLAYKRAFDLCGAATALTLFALPMLCIALAIKLEKRGPVLYRQRRVTVGHRTFIMLKFRTMRMDAEAGGPVFASENDPRCTRVGRWLRWTCLDELPQLFNILMGEMSLVGPRPERPEMLEGIHREIPDYPRRLSVRAGLTGWAQIHGYRGRTCFRRRLQHDLYYIENWSPMLDMRIIVTTVFRGFRGGSAE